MGYIISFALMVIVIVLHLYNDKLQKEEKSRMSDIEKEYQEAKRLSDNLITEIGITIDTRVSVVMNKYESLPEQEQNVIAVEILEMKERSISLLKDLQDGQDLITSGQDSIDIKYLSLRFFNIQSQLVLQRIYADIDDSSNTSIN